MPPKKAPFKVGQKQLKKQSKLQKKKQQSEVDDDEDDDDNDKNSPEASQEHEQQNSPRISGRVQQESQQESGSDDGSNDDDDDDDSDQESSSSIAPENLAVRNMQFRERRGTKMNYLISRKKEEEDDPFWANNAGYFGDLDMKDEEDQQDYVQSSSGRDFFDSDFGHTESEHSDKEQGDQKRKSEDLDEEEEKARRKKHQMIMNIKKPQEGKKPDPSKSKAPKKHGSEQVGNRYIHQMFTQQQLLGQAAHTEYFNWLSYRKLISLETVKKDYTKKKHNIEGDKIIYRDRIGENGVREVSYELHGPEVNSIQDLTNIWNK